MSENAVYTENVVIKILTDLTEEVTRQDASHPDGFPFTRDGIRLGIAALEDEVLEVWKHDHDSSASSGRTDYHAGPDQSEAELLRKELMQVMAVAFRMVRSIDE